ncbi:predicted protein [Botrytis cinerea T4]|uniref:Uncharacterized protein n=1 Tax=Botryotinia fuckeliana (strain T4) TaxID=999810 RepID=G2YSE1_BOTF4|nr:predicted protein [Botrytis cinerea T4]
MSTIPVPTLTTNLSSAKRLRPRVSPRTACKTPWIVKDKLKKPLDDHVTSSTSSHHL